MLLDLIEAETLQNAPNCIGERVDEIVVSEYWPTFGLALSSGYFLYARDWGTPYKFGLYIEPIAEDNIKHVYAYGGRTFSLSVPRKNPSGTDFGKN